MFVYNEILGQAAERKRG